MPTKPTRRVPPTGGDHQRYLEMLACLRVMQRVAKYYFHKGDSKEREKTAKAACAASRKFYKDVVVGMDCGTDCWENGVCVECKGLQPV